MDIADHIREVRGVWKEALPELRDQAINELIDAIEAAKKAGLEAGANRVEQIREMLKEFVGGEITAADFAVASRAQLIMLRMDVRELAAERQAAAEAMVKRIGLRAFQVALTML